MLPQHTLTILKQLKLDGMARLRRAARTTAVGTLSSKNASAWSSTVNSITATTALPVRRNATSNTAPRASKISTIAPAADSAADRQSCQLRLDST